MTQVAEVCTAQQQQQQGGCSAQGMQEVAMPQGIQTDV